MTDAGSAGAPKGLQSAAPIGARGVSNPGCRSSILICRILQSSDEIRVPPARRSRRPTVVPVRLLPPSYVFYGISCLGGAQNSNSGRIRAQILETLRKLRSPGAQNSNSGHLRAQILDTLCKLRSPSRPNRPTDLIMQLEPPKSADRPLIEDFKVAAVTRRRRPQLLYNTASFLTSMEATLRPRRRRGARSRRPRRRRRTSRSWRR